MEKQINCFIFCSGEVDDNNLNLTDWCEKFDLFEDPDGIRVEVNYVPGQGHFGKDGRLGSEGQGPANTYGEDGLTNT